MEIAEAAKAFPAAVRKERAGRSPATLFRLRLIVFQAGWRLSMQRVPEIRDAESF